eukprot:TRINITY_DN24637_c0_g1_i1.p1 TRINITY_DN24637_c0_g1~~TRINITY_DN24637_c0_g1_i1.p1  ORF type:complete len:332 (-),score=90.72 TRINITY_DN24637_c0_g1_i1:176-1084(-)
MAANVATASSAAAAGVDADDVLRALMEVLTAKKVRPAELFRKIDTSGDGSLEADELRQGFADMGFKTTDEEFAAIMPRFDKDGGGDVSLREFERAMKAAEKLGPPRRKEVVEEEVVKKKKQGLTEEDKEEFRQIFCLFKQLCRKELDEDGNELPLVQWDDSGSISKDELEELLETVGMKVAAGDLEMMVSELDKNGDGEIDFHEFCENMSKRVQVPHAPEEIENSFKLFARKAPEGMIRVDDLRNALTTYMHKELSLTEIDALLHYYKDGFVKLPGSEHDYFNYQDYVELMAPVSGPIEGES